MRSVCIAMWCLFTASLSFGQTLKEFLSKGDRYFSKKDYQNALSVYQEALRIAPDDAEANFKVGVSYLQTVKKSVSLSYLKKAYELNPKVDLDIEYHLGLAYQNNHEYDKAKSFYEAFKQKNKRLSNICDHKIRQCIIGDSLSRNETDVRIENLGDVLNTTYHEYAPLLSDDGNTLIFTSNRPSEESVRDQEEEEGENYEDIYISHRSEYGWSTPKKISRFINSPYHDAAASLSHDGKTLFLYYEEGAGDIYVSELQDNEWTKPVALNKNINSSQFWETSASMSADKKKLYFTSNRPGGFGELDIYVSERDAKGDWGKAVNLGPTINTPSNEDSPFIHEDGVTLYFSSDGHPSLGSNDIFKSVFNNNRWSVPENLGYPINTVDYDGFFTLSPDKKTGYFSAIREDGIGNADLYRVTFPDEKPVVEQPAIAEQLTPQAGDTEMLTDEYIDPMITLQKDLQIVTLLKGKIIDAATMNPLRAKITLVNNESNETVIRIYSNENGDFELVIPHGGNYGVATESAGYLFNSINFNLPQFAEYQEIDTHILMMRAEVGSKAVLKNIFFDTGKSDLKMESVAELEKIRELLVANDHMHVRINGHTDNTGNASVNEILSLKRAESVVEYLVQKGIDRMRLSAKGFGAERPLVSNDDENEGREINRRTEIEVVSLTQ